MIITELVLRCL